MKTTTYRIKIAAADYERLRGLVSASLPLEGAAFGLAGIAVHAHGTDILVRRIVELPPELYQAQEEIHLEIAPKAINGLASLCESNGLGAVVCHSHSVDVPYSPSDDFGEERLYRTLQRFMPPAFPMASLLVRPSGLSARVWSGDGWSPVLEVIIVGDHLDYALDANRRADEAPDGAHARQVLALGAAGQAAIERVRIGIVGVGGTGSPCAEQLVRLGVRDLLLIDRDTLESSNLSRVYGSAAADVRAGRVRLKVEVVREHLRRINPAATVNAIADDVAHDSVARSLVTCDAILLCTDEHWGRSVVNQLSYQYLIPTINLGLAIRREGSGGVTGVGVVDVLRPDTPCLWCKQFLDSKRIAAESMPEQDRGARAAEGYVQDIYSPAPSVVTMTTTVSGLGASVLLHVMTGFMGVNGDLHRLNYDPVQSTVRRGRSTIDRECICQKVRGYGDLRVLPTVVSSKGKNHAEE